MNKISLLIKTNVHSALVHEKSVKKVASLLEQAKAACVLQRAVKAFQKRSWARKFVKIDPVLRTLVDEEREVEKHILDEANKKQKFVVGVPEPEVAISPVDFDDFVDEQDDFVATPLAGHITGGPSGVGETPASEQSFESHIRHFGGGQSFSRPRTATGMSDLTRSSASPTRTRGYSMASSAGDLAMSPPRLNSEATVNTSGQGVVNQHSMFGTGIKGMEINTLSEKERQMRHAAASDRAVQEAIELQKNEKRRRSTVMYAISDTVTKASR